MMEWAQVVGIASWCFLIGIFVGQAAEKIHGEKKHDKSAPEVIFEEGLKDVRQVEKFAGAPARSVSVFIDQKSGEKWRCIIEREEA